MATRHKQLHRLGEAAQWKCNYCLRQVDCILCNPNAKMAATRDHVIPRSRGGRGAGNLVIACQRCNSNKGDRLLTEIGLPERPQIVRKVEGKPRPGCKKTRSGTIRTPFQTRELAVLMCQAVVKVKPDVDLAAYHCIKCGQWHISRREHVLTLIDRGHAMEMAG